jgi:hypothetical protein
MTKRERFNEIKRRHEPGIPEDARKWFHIGLSFGWDACRERAAEVQSEAIDAEPRGEE